MNKNYKFGFRDVAEKEKGSLVKTLFNSVASKYDLMNNLMSLGIHHLWKREMLKTITNPSGKVLDVAGGTGDISISIAKKAWNRSKSADITVCDISQEMLNQGRDKAYDLGIINEIKWVCGNAEILPFEDNSFDYYTISFGLRNVTNIDKAIAEAYRVLKPGGKFICLEFSKPTNPVIEKIYDTYSFSVIPWLGEFVANDRAAYQYLVESIRMFPEQNKLLQMIEEAGFKMANYNNLTFGVTAIHWGFKI